MNKAKTRYRALAAFADFIITAVIIVLILILFGRFGDVLNILNSTEISYTFFDLLNVTKLSLAIMTFIILYFTVIPLLLNGQTVGMYMFKICYIRSNGKKLDYGSLFVHQILVCWLFSFLTFGIGIFVNFLVMMYRKDNASLADVVSRIYCVDKLDY